jgi:serine/threonine-protein kinase
MAGSEGDTKQLLEQELAPELDVLRKLKDGSASELFLARQKSLDRLVVIKVLPTETSGDSVARARFERGARAVASLAHPNAVSVYRFGWLNDSVPFLIMQYVNGPSLEEKLAAEGRLSVHATRSGLGQLAGALAEAHRNGFVHRDISPANVLWDRERDQFLLTDFGLAGLLPKHEGELPRLTRVGEVLGSSGYMSPEQLKGGDPTEGTDVYALGVLAYEMLTGEGPFPGKAPQQVGLATLKSPPRPLRTLRAEVDEATADLIERCLEKEPGRRPSADFLAQAFSSPGSSGGAELSPVPQEDVVAAMIRRRLPRTVVTTGAIGAALLYFVDTLADRGLVGEVVFQFALLTFFCSLAAAGVIAWFHGAKGKQHVVAIEVALLSFIGLVWISMGVFLFLPR